MKTQSRKGLQGRPRERDLAPKFNPRPGPPRLHPGQSAERSGYTAVQGIWDDLYAAGVDLVLNGHVHAYERFAPQAPVGSADANGITQFIVGTAGAELRGDSPPMPLPTSQVEQGSVFGVLRLTLHAASYEWEFVPEAGGRFADAGTAACH